MLAYERRRAHEAAVAAAKAKFLAEKEAKEAAEAAEKVKALESFGLDVEGADYDGMSPTADEEEAAARAKLMRGMGAVGTDLTRDVDGASLLVSRASAQGCVDALRAAVRRASKEGGGPVRLRVDGPLRLR